eukprot:8662423-Pyramimonas_sp.AAC.1
MHHVDGPVLDVLEGRQLLGRHEEGAAPIVNERVHVAVLLESTSQGLCRHAVALWVLLLDCGNDAPFT